MSASSVSLLSLFQACEELYSEGSQSGVDNDPHGNEMSPRSRKQKLNVKENEQQENDIDTQIDLFADEDDSDLYGNHSNHREGMLQFVDGTWDDVTPSNQKYSNNHNKQSVCDSNNESSNFIGHTKSRDHTSVLSLDGTCDIPSDGEDESPIPQECRRRGRSTGTPLGQKRSLSDNSPNKLSRSGKKSRRTLYAESGGTIYTPHKENTLKSGTPAKTVHSDEEIKNYSKQGQLDTSIKKAQLENMADVSALGNDTKDSAQDGNQNANTSSYGLDSPISSQADSSMEGTEDVELKQDMTKQYYKCDDKPQRRSASDPHLFDRVKREDSYNSYDNTHDMGANAGADIKREEYLNDPQTGKANVKKMVRIVQIILHL